MKEQYFRIVYFDNNRKFKKLEIKKECEFNIDLLIRQNPYPKMEIYKCNSKGNNYSGRMVYP